MNVTFEKGINPIGLRKLGRVLDGLISQVNSDPVTKLGRNSEDGRIVYAWIKIHWGCPARALMNNQRDEENWNLLLWLVSRHSLDAINV